MAIQNVKRWQWIGVSLLVGFALGYIQQLPRQNWQKAFGETLSQQQFEEGLTREQSGLRWFRNITVYPEHVEVGGENVPISIVAGDYFDGRLEMQDGQRVAVWRPRCYIAEEPYQPLTPHGGFQGKTVMEYLQSLPGVSYRYAWWRDPTWGMGIWTAGSVVVIGLIWPTVINLLAFGSLVRPQEEKRMDLSKVSSSSSQPSGSQVSAAVEWMGAEMEAKLAAEAGSPPAAAPTPPGVSPVRALTGTSLEAAAAELVEEEKAFGQEKDDFYPTELHPPHPKGE